MTGEEMKAVMNFEDGLTVGDQVTVRWTNCHRYFVTSARVHKVNKKSIVVSVMLPLTTDLGVYPAGQRIRVPRLTFSTINLWSVNNRVEPQRGYRAVQA